MHAIWPAIRVCMKLNQKTHLQQLTIKMSSSLLRDLSYTSCKNTACENRHCRNKVCVCEFVCMCVYVCV